MGTPRQLDSLRRPPVRNLGGTNRAKPLNAGGRRGKERAARNERSSDWRRGAAGSPDPNLVLCGGSPREGARSEERAEPRLAAGGRRLPRPGTPTVREAS